jgi:hypothetical protein
MSASISRVAAFLLLGVLLTSAGAAQVAIYTGTTSWITKALADAQAQICVDRLTSAGISFVWYKTAADEAALATWVTGATDNGEPEVLVLFGHVPTTIYGSGNTQANGSKAELFIESTDGDAIINHADWMFFVPNNGVAGLQNIMDLPAITCGNYDVPMVVTDAGREIAPSLTDFLSDRPPFITMVVGDWFVEAALAQSADGTQADPVIVRDGDRGRLIFLYETGDQDDPKGRVAAEVIAWLTGKKLMPSQLALSGSATTMTTSVTTVTKTPVRLTLRLLDGAGIPTPFEFAKTVTLASTSATGRFDTAWEGNYDGTVTSVTLPAGTTSATLYYRDSAVGLATLSASTSDVLAADLDVNVLEDLSTGERGEVAIYTGNTSWIYPGPASVDAEICIEKLELMGVTYEWFEDPADQAALADWVTARTTNGTVDVLILYGYLPASIYTPSASPTTEGSIAETFIESTDGNAIINHGDWMFFVSSTNNGAAGLQSMMDIPGISMNDSSVVSVTDQGAAIAPSLAGITSFRSLSVDQLAGDWFVEAVLAQNAAGTRADPIIVRDGSRGRLIPALQRYGYSDPLGAVGAEIIAWLYGIDIGDPSRVGIAGRAVGLQGRPVRLEAQTQGSFGSPSAAGAPTTVNLLTDSATGAFDIAANGSFDGTVTSVTVAAGESSATFYYKDTAAGTPTLTGSSAGLANGTRGLTIFEKGSAAPGEVAIYTGAVNWIDKAVADAQAQICVNRLDSLGIPYVWYKNTADEAALATWVTQATGNNELDVLVLYGHIPTTIYGSGNTQPNGSKAELFIESIDGDAIINHADWMFYVPGNGTAALQYMMDITGIGCGTIDVPMVVTDIGRKIAPTLTDYLSDRPLNIDQLAYNWVVEAALAQSADGTWADPVIVRDGNRGRLIPLYQTSYQDDPKGAVAAEIIAWLMGEELLPTQLVLSGSKAAVTGTPVKFTLKLLDDGGFAVPLASALTVNLAVDGGTGAFDTAWEGSYDGSVTSVTIPAGKTSATFYFRGASAGLVTLSATASGVPDAELEVNVLDDVSVAKGEVAIYTYRVGWMLTADAEEQAQICADALDALGITNTLFASAEQELELADWVSEARGNGKQDVLVLYGYFPSTIYPAGNTSPDNSIAELFIESTDGDAIINHGDYMFYVSSPNNGVTGLRNMMDISTISLGADDTPVVVTDQGAAIAPRLRNFMTDRPFFYDQLAGNWFVEAALAENASGTLAEPCIVRDGNQGRLIAVHQAMYQEDPKGAVAAEIIAWLMEKATGVVEEPKFIRGDVNGDAKFNIADPVCVLAYLFGMETPDNTCKLVTVPACFDASDCNDDGKLNIADPTYLLGYLFASNTPPPPPFEQCGYDESPATAPIGCVKHDSCP